MVSIGRLTVAGAVIAATGLLGAPDAATSRAEAFPTVRWIAAHSSNYSARSSRSIRRVVIHTVEGSEAGCISWFQNRTSNVSAHYVVSYTGRITQMVRDKDVAWHAGNSAYNETSIGIECEGYAGQNRWTDAQYRALADLVRGLCDRYGIPKDRSAIIGHKEVPNQSHWDPGPNFNWTRFMNLVRGTTTTTTSGGSSGQATHTVRSGETLSGIAARYGVTTAAIVAANNLRNANTIYPGQVLVIPGQTYSPNRTTTTSGATTGMWAVEPTTDGLNVRDGIWGNVLGQIGRGQRFAASHEQGGWLKIDWRGRDAWVSASHVRRVAGVDAVVVTTDNLNVRAAASTTGARLGYVTRDQAYPRLGQSGEWVLIQYDQRRAWVHGSYTRAVSLR